MSIDSQIKKGRPNLRPHQVAILAAGIVSLLVWAIPGVQMLMLPMQYLNTHLHELGHAFAAQISGGDVDMITVLADGNGATPVTGGSMWLIGPAGYVGAAMIGAAVIWFSRTEKTAKNTLRLLAFFLALSMLLWVRGDFVGVISGIAWVGALFAASTFLHGNAILFAAQFIGLQQCLNSINAVYTLLNLSAFNDVHSDAKIMQNNTGVPAMVWAFGWCAFALVLVAISLKRAWSAG
ncbi:MAG TPA: M50 family metallopeptidase [Fimbriimonas sp.]|nr:M50 family metallopeptidase [Fimbriimonas sp.]